MRAVRGSSSGGEVWEGINGEWTYIYSNAIQG